MIEADYCVHAASAGGCSQYLFIQIQTKQTYKGWHSINTNRCMIEADYVSMQPVRVGGHGERH
jgi:hypothetical protein